MEGLPAFLGLVGYIILDITAFLLYQELKLSFHPFVKPGLPLDPVLFFFLRRGKQVPEKLVSRVPCKVLEFFESLYNSSG